MHISRDTLLCIIALCQYGRHTFRTCEIKPVVDWILGVFWLLHRLDCECFLYCAWQHQYVSNRHRIDQYLDTLLVSSQTAADHSKVTIARWQTTQIIVSLIPPNQSQ